MNGMKILERIITEEGSCCWATPSICKSCPLGTLIRSDDGRFISCVEAIDIEGLSEEEADIKYKRAAAKKLADIALDQIIEAD